ncbi:MAG: MFS transporter [Planctomycetota bacterium]|nr:MFS transporter [Planctomycetota bacterium]
MNSEEDVTTPQQWLILIILIVVQFTAIVDFMVVIPLAPDLKEVFGLTTTQFSWVVSSYTFAAGIVALAASPFLDRFSRRFTFLVCYAGFLLGTLACGIAPSYVTLLCARILTGAFGGLLGGTALAIIGDTFPEHRRGRASGALMTAFALASVCGVPIGIVLGQNYGWNLPFFVITGLGLPVLVMAYLALPALDAHLHSRSRSSFGAQLVQIVSDTNHQWAFALTTAMQFGSFMVVTSASDFLVNNVGIDQHDLPYAYVLGGALVLITSPLVGRWADRVGKPPVYRVMAWAAAAVFLTLTHLPATSMFVALPVLSLLMVCNGGRMVPAMAMITSSVAPHRRGSFLSVNSAVQHVASGIGASCSGLILTGATDGPISGYGTVGWIAAVVTVGSIWIAGQLRIYQPDAVVEEITPEEAIAIAGSINMDAPEPLIPAEAS